MSTIKIGQPSHLYSDEAYAMVAERHGKEEITDACAATIASWWQSPGNTGYAMAQLASTGTVDYQELVDDIAAVYPAAEGKDRVALDMLGTWALAHELGRAG